MTERRRPKGGLPAGGARLLSTLPSPVEREIYGGHAAQTAGITPEAMAQEVKKAFQQRVRKETKKKERQDLTPAMQLQPKQRGLRYENIRSARAEEGVIRLLLLDSGLYRDMQGLEEKEFSSPLLGRAYGLLMQRAREGHSTHLASAGFGFRRGDGPPGLCAGQPQSIANSRQSLADYISVIRTEAIKRGAADDRELLLAAQKKNLEKKAYMEEKP